MNATLAPEHATTTGDPTVPDELSSPRSKLIYLYLTTVGGCTVDELRTSLGEKVISLYHILSSLVDRGLVERDGRTYRPIGA